MDVFYFLMQQTLPVAIPLLLVAIGGMFSERSGTINIALEGIMIIGAFIGTVFIHSMQANGSALTGQGLYIVTSIIVAICGGIYALLLAYASINMKADQTIVGTALNMIAPALTIFVARTFFQTRNIEIANVFYIHEVPGLSKIPFIGDILFKNTYLSLYIGIAILIVATIVLYRTRFGLRLMSCGEHPQAADSAGINVYRMRYAGVIISGILGALGGFYFVTATTTGFSGSVAGYGFLALAVMIFGQWKPMKIFGAALFFAFMVTLAAGREIVPFLSNLKLKGDIYNMLPYLVTMIVLAFTSKKSRAPKAEGIPYDKGKR